jgi:CheY-like chemotaxis protein
MHADVPTIRARPAGGSRANRERGTDDGQPGPVRDGLNGRPGRQLILVADDEPSIRDLIEALLTQEGFLCRGVSNGEQLLGLLSSVIPAAVVLDIRMPGLDGFGVMERLRLDPDLRLIPVVAVGANSDPVLVLAAGCRAFVPKPFVLDDLAGAVHSAVGTPLQRPA